MFSLLLPQAIALFACQNNICSLCLWCQRSYIKHAHYFFAFHFFTRKVFFPCELALNLISVQNRQNLHVFLHLGVLGNNLKTIHFFTLPKEGCHVMMMLLAMQFSKYEEGLLRKVSEEDSPLPTQCICIQETPSFLTI